MDATYACTPECESASVDSIPVSGKSDKVLIGVRIEGKGAETDIIVLMRRGEK